MNFRVQFQISRVGTSLFSGGTVYVYVLMALYSELAVCSCQIIDSQPVVYIQCVGRYFYTQCQSPEPRDVVVVVHGGSHIWPLLRNIAKGTFNNLNLMDQVGSLLAKRQQNTLRKNPACRQTL